MDTFPLTYKAISPILIIRFEIRAPHATDTGDNSGCLYAGPVRQEDQDQGPHPRAGGHQRRNPKDGQDELCRVCHIRDASSYPVTLDRGRVGTRAGRSLAPGAPDPGPVQDHGLEKDPQRHTLGRMVHVLRCLDTWRSSQGKWRCPMAGSELSGDSWICGHEPGFWPVGREFELIHDLIPFQLPSYIFSDLLFIKTNRADTVSFCPKVPPPSTSSSTQYVYRTS